MLPNIVFPLPATSMATLLNKFRIDYQDMTILPDVGRKPSDAR